MVVVCYNADAVELVGQEASTRYIDKLLLIYFFFKKGKKKTSHLLKLFNLEGKRKQLNSGT